MSSRLENAREARMRSWTIGFIGSDEEVKHLFAEEIEEALRAAFREAREWITEENGEKFN